MKRSTFWMGVFLLALAMLASSCGKRQHITLSKTNLTYSYSGGNDLFEVVADCNWEITDIPNWMTVNPTSGNGNGNVAVNVSRNTTGNDRNQVLQVVSENGKTKRGIQIIQTKADISALLFKVWFTLSDERWDTDYWNHVIPESYRNYHYYSDDIYEHWFFYFFSEHHGYQVRTYNGDTINYPFTFTFYPDVDSLDMSFDPVGDTVVLEDYHTIIHRLDNEFFVISHAYRPHQYEKITTANVTGEEKAVFSINPKKVKAKPKGALIPVD